MKQLNLTITMLPVPVVCIEKTIQYFNSKGKDVANGQSSLSHS